jgi:hypothetical protein
VLTGDITLSLRGAERRSNPPSGKVDALAGREIASSLRSSH